MSSFLELCQMVGRESGTAPGNQPYSVAGQTGRLAKIVHWTNEAWVAIQNARDDWQFMREEYAGTVSPAMARYVPSALGIHAMGAFLPDRTGYRPHSIYPSATGVQDETSLRQTNWEDWRQRFGRGVQTPQRPAEYAISPKGDFCRGPIPDAVYVLRGEYRRRASRMVDNDDEPQLPGQFHDMIAWRAIMLLDEHDEAIEAIRIGRARNIFAETFSALVRSQTERIRIGYRAIA